MLLKGKVVIIIGAASARDLGFITAKLFADSGVKMVIIDLSGRANKTAATALDKGHLGLATNVADEVQVRMAIEQILAKYGRVDVLMDNARITQPLKLIEIKRTNYDAILDAGLRGTLLMSQAAIPAMRAQKSSSIVCASSVSAQHDGSTFGGPHYSVARAGVLGLARAMIHELGPDNVRINCITLGLIQTGIAANELTDDMTANTLAGIPMNRLSDAVDTARTVLFLSSDLSSCSIGTTLDANDGMLIY